MQLKHKGTTVQVTLNKPELVLLSKAETLLTTMHELPWEHKEAAGKAAEALDELLAGINESPDTPKE